MRRLICVLSLFALCAVGALPVRARVAATQAPGPLPKTVQPVLYDISVVPDMKSMRITGSERVTINVLRPVTSIVLNALQTTIRSARLDGLSAAAITNNSSAQTVAFRFARPVSAGRHVLSIAYVATLQTTAQGLFVQNYQDAAGKPARMLGTQMEATDARRMFPGFDEPAFRARFHLTATVPSAWTAVSNMPVEHTVQLGELKRVSFGTTPSMSTYLLVLCAGDFDEVSGSAGKTAIHIYGTRGKGAELHYALASLERLVPYFETYYGIKFPLPKLDLISIPGFFGGAMENWGGMTFTEDSVVYNPALQPPIEQRNVFDIIAHETSHQWNGDLVTMAWWDGLWLNEGFATWMETKSTAALNPSWDWWLNFDSGNDGTMISDARRTTHPVQMPVHNETEANEVFDELSYQKSGAFLRMIEQYLGAQTFRRGLHTYFVANAYGNTVPGDLWAALSAASNKNVAAISYAWINERGFPVVHVQTACSGGKRTIRLSQNRYTSDGAASGSTIWDIPLNIESAPGHFSPYLFAARTASVAAGSCAQPLVVNGDDVGYYRVAYDAPASRLQQQYFRRLSVADRIGLLNDAWVFAEDGKARLAAFMAYLRADSGDSDTHVARTILGDIESMNQYEYGKPGEAAFKAFAARTYLRPLLAALGGWDAPSNDPERESLRYQVLGALAEAGDRPTIDQARKRFTAMLANPSQYAPGMKNAIFGIVGRYADQPTYDKLIQMGMSARNPIEMETDFASAFSAKDPALAERSLEMSLRLPAQFQSYGPVIVAIVGQDHPELAWAFLKKNTAKLFGSMSLFDRLPYISGIASSFWRSVPEPQIEAYLRANMPPSAKLEIDKAIETVTLSQRHRQVLVPQIDALTGY